MATRTWIKPDGPDRGFKILEFDDLDNESMLVHAQKQGYVEFQRPLTLEDPEGWFSGAYEYFPEEKKVKINLDKAKAGYLDFLRKARAQKLEELDRKHLRALVSKDEKKIEEIEELKQTLRDMPEKLPLDRITNVFELVHLFPPILLPDE
jgi:flagellar motility protein MotE (MotC chaperone)